MDYQPLSTLQLIGFIIMIVFLVVTTGIFIWSYYAISTILKEQGIKQNWYNPFHFYFAFRKMNKNTSDPELKKRSDQILLYVHRLLMALVIFFVVLDILLSSQ
jgi:thiosulfate reductase cytochrome b subunit